MPRIVWNDTFSVHVPEIDDQHKKWIDIINELHDTLMRQQGKVLLRITGETFRAMEEYSRFHFDYEEEYMRKINYPGLERHKQEHDDFRIKIVGYQKELEAGDLILNSEVMKILMNWLTQHILTQDKGYSSYADSAAYRSP